MSLKKYIICSFCVQSALCGIECALLLLSYFQLERFHSSCQLRVEVSHRCVCQRLLWSILHLPCQEVCCAANDRHGRTSWTSEDIAICASQSHHNHITITSHSHAVWPIWSSGVMRESGVQSHSGLYSNMHGNTPWAVMAIMKCTNYQKLQQRNHLDYTTVVKSASFSEIHRGSPKRSSITGFPELAAVNVAMMSVNVTR